MTAQTGIEKERVVDTCYRFDGLAMNYKELLRSYKMGERTLTQIHQVLDVLQAFKENRLVEVETVKLLKPSGSIKIPDQLLNISSHDWWNDRSDINYYDSWEKFVPATMPLLGLSKAQLHMFELKHDAKDGQIRKVLPDPHVFTLNQFLTWLPFVIDVLLKKEQGNDSDEPLINLFYVKRAKKNIVAVKVAWYPKPEQWFVLDFPLNNGSQDDGGIRVFSCECSK